MRLKQLLSVLCLSFLVASCGQRESVEAAYPLKTGTIVTLKAFDRLYDSEVVRVGAGYSSWKTKWGDQEVSRHKEYRGVMVVSGREGDIEFYREFDVSAVDKLFPLKVGAETSFGGIYRNEKAGTQRPFWTHMLVRAADSVKLKSGEVPVFIIDVTSKIETGQGTERTERVMWYSPDLGISLKTEYRRGEEYFQLRVLKVKPPSGAADPMEPSRRSLGTVMI